MSFQSQAQRGYMYVHHPEIAKRFEKETPKGKKLPYHKQIDAMNKMSKSALKQSTPKQSTTKKSAPKKAVKSSPKERTPGGFYGTKNYDPSMWD